MPGSTKDQCKDFYVSNLGSLDRGTGSKAMKALEQNPSKNSAIKKILNLPNIEMFAESDIKYTISKKRLEEIVQEEQQRFLSEKKQTIKSKGSNSENEVKSPHKILAPGYLAS